MNARTFNTKGGNIGFRAELVDGRVYEEFACTWDDVPKHVPLKALKIVQFRTGHVFACVDGMAEYFFSNEATQTAGFDGSKGVTRHSAKIFGGVKTDGEAIKARLDWPDDSLLPLGSRELLPRDRLRLSEAAFRRGAGAIIL